jgi:hypothetical protein
MPPKRLRRPIAMRYRRSATSGCSNCTTIGGTRRRTGGCPAAQSRSGPIPLLLPHVMLVDVLPSGRYRDRLIGTENAREHGINATGCYLDEVLPGPEYQGHVLGLYDECVRTRRALYSECLFLSLKHGPERHTKVLFLPLSDDGARVNIVLVGQVFLYLDRAVRDRHLIDTKSYKEIAHILL